MRETPWAIFLTWIIAIKWEFGLAEYRESTTTAASQGIMWFASCWDDLGRFHQPIQRSLLQDRLGALTNHSLLAHTRRASKPVLLSTGMSTLDEIDLAVKPSAFRDLVIMHAVSNLSSSL